MLHLRVFGAASVMERVAESVAALPGAEHVTRTDAGNGAGQALVTADVDPDAADSGPAGAQRSRCARRRRLAPAPGRAAAREPGPQAREQRGRVGRPARPGGRARPARRALSRPHGRGRRHRGLWRHLRQRHPHRRRHGGEPRLPADRVGVHRARSRAAGASSAGPSGRSRPGSRRPAWSPACSRPCSTSSGCSRRTSRSASTRSRGSPPSTTRRSWSPSRPDVAGILALETRASAAVGVAISVTTIPASAYLGVAAGVGELDKASGALAVLAINVAMLLVGGSLTLLAQQALTRASASVIEKLASIALAGRQQRQLGPAVDERVGRGRHGLEGDHVVVGGGEDLRVGIAGEERELDAPAVPGRGRRAPRRPARRRRRRTSSPPAGPRAPPR